MKAEILCQGCALGQAVLAAPQWLLPVTGHLYNKNGKSRQQVLHSNSVLPPSQGYFQLNSLTPHPNLLPLRLLSLLFQNSLISNPLYETQLTLLWYSVHIAPPPSSLNTHTSSPHKSCATAFLTWPDNDSNLRRLPIRLRLQTASRLQDTKRYKFALKSSTPFFTRVISTLALPRIQESREIDPLGEGKDQVVWDSRAEQLSRPSYHSTG